MNIFFSNCDIQGCARDHCTIHRNKQIVEYAQMLSTAHRVLDGDDYADEHGLYKRTHQNHPSAVWVRQSDANYTWLWSLLLELVDQYYADTGKWHKTSKLVGPLCIPPRSIPRGEFTEPTPAMLYEFITGNTASDYRNYLNAKYIEWLSRDKPMKLKWFHDQPDWLSDDVRKMLTGVGE